MNYIKNIQCIYKVYTENMKKDVMTCFLSFCIQGFLGGAGRTNYTVCLNSVQEVWKHRY